MPLKSAVVLVMFTVAVSGQTSLAGDRFYQAIRQDDLAALRALVREEGVNAKDAQGQTPLMLAAAFGSAEAIRFLIASGADVRAASSSGVTALHWGASDVTKARMLLDANADVNAVSQIGRTPLIVAASATGTVSVVRMMLAQGADVNAADLLGVTPLIAAASVDNLDVANLLLAHGADAQAAARISVPSTPLMSAAVNGNAELVGTLLARKPDLSVRSADLTAVVVRGIVGAPKNGAPRLGNLTALHAAVTGGNPDVVERLLAADAPADAVDVRGMTPLMWAVATDRPQSRVVRLLLAKGAKPDLQSAAGESAIDWARKFNNPAVLAELELSPVVPTAAPALDASRRPASAREAVARSLPILSTASGRMMTDGGCAACHAQPLTAMAVDAARARGWTTLSSNVESAQSTMLMTAFAPQLLQLRELGGMPDSLVYATLLMATQRTPSNRATDAVVHYLAGKQRREGNWDGVGATRAPMQDGNFSRTAMSIRALAVYATPARAGEFKERVQRAGAWLSRQAPITTEDRVMQLLGLHWANADGRAQRMRSRELLVLQREDGGWAQTPHLASDAYATGQVLYVLRELGVPAADPALRRGAAFLLRTQCDDGSWHVKSRAMKIQVYFESGFPHGHDQWISQAATAWATMGLVAAP
jgi:ankyrin repeat protein